VVLKFHEAGLRMDIDLDKISGIGAYYEELLKIDDEQLRIFHVGEDVENKAFFVVRKNTVELRTDRKLGQLLREKYESVMESRYFGRGGIEIVMSGQLKKDEIEDLVRLSYNLTISL